MRMCKAFKVIQSYINKVYAIVMLLGSHRPNTTALSYNSRTTTTTTLTNVNVYKIIQTAVPNMQNFTCCMQK